ncbi:MAG: hypothetical protein AB8B65_09245 [Kordia sp.]|uniref:hypothetical protein n=1 Tax=Kordia sp. TaxID=1965332 RepID=UPI00385FDB55
MEPKNPISLTPLQCIENWGNCRKNQTSVANSLLTGNSFHLKVGLISPMYNRLHIYIGKSTPLEQSGGISFYGVPSVCDYENTLKAEYHNYSIEQGQGAKTLPQLIDSKLVPINFTEKPFAYNIENPNPAEKLLIESINNWNIAAHRQSWLDSKFPEGEGFVLAAFDIDVSDFEPLHGHECFLALKPAPENGKNYVLDLVILNTTSKKFLNLQETENGVSLRDLARLVPPFGQAGLPSTNESNFGILQNF